MKQRIFLCVGLGLALAFPVFGDRCISQKPSTCQISNGDGVYENQDGSSASTACDPCFITACRYLPSAAIAARSSKQDDVKTQGVSELSTDESALVAALRTAKDPAKLREKVLEVWRSTASVELQRYAAAYARAIPGTTGDGQTYELMLTALEDPEAEIKKCRELGRGNGLMKKQATERLAILMQNPNLKEKVK